MVDIVQLAYNYAGRVRPSSSAAESHQKHKYSCYGYLQFKVKPCECICE